MRRMLSIYNWLLAPIPGVRAMRFKIWWLRKCGIVIGSGVSIATQVRFDLLDALVSIGDNVRIDANVSFALYDASISIGEGAAISSFVRFKGTGNIEIGKSTSIRDFVFVHILENTIIVGDNVCVAENVVLESLRDAECGGVLKIGSNCDVMQYTFLSANGKSKVSIGDYCKIAHGVSVKATHHRIDPSRNCIGDTSLFDDINIGEGCWICAGAVIVPGVNVAKKCVVAAGAIVTKNPRAYSLSAGIPASEKKIYLDEAVGFLSGGG